jgi:hypothetical protein
MTRIPIRPCVPALVAGLLIAACDPEAPPSQDRQEKAIAEAKARWKAKEPERYSYTFRPVCFCPLDSLRVTATRDSVIQVVSLRAGSQGSVPSPQSYSIESLFQGLEGALQSHPDVLRMSFDPEYGFPDSVVIDPDKQAEDDEYSQYISGFRVESAR